MGQAPAGPETGFVPLFNGKDFTGWKPDRGDPAQWRVENGQITAHSHNYLQQSFLLSDMSFTDFQMRFEFYLPKEADSGFVFRAVGGETPSPLEVNLRNAAGIVASTGAVRVFRHGEGQGYLAPTAPPVLRGEPNWEEMEVEARGDILRVSVNGTLVQNLDLSEYAKNPNALPGVTRKAGRIGFQCHTGVVRFRNVRIKGLPKAASLRPVATKLKMPARIPAEGPAPSPGASGESAGLSSAMNLSRSLQEKGLSGSAIGTGTITTSPSKRKDSERGGLKAEFRSGTDFNPIDGRNPNRGYWLNLGSYAGTRFQVGHWGYSKTSEIGSRKTTFRPQEWYKVKISCAGQAAASKSTIKLCSASTTTASRRAA